MQKKIYYRAGLVPYHYCDDGEIRYMFMKPSETKYGGDEFQMAKGKIENDESAEEAAVREAIEELGLRRDNIVYLFELGVFLGRTTVFFAEVKNMEDFDPFHHETSDVTWMTLDEFLEKGRPLHHELVNYGSMTIPPSMK